MRIGQTIITNNPNSDKNLFDKDSIKVYQLGIQAMPGTKFQIGNNTDSIIQIGSTGIYELDLKGITTIDAIYCKQYINKTIIIDFLYEGGNN